MSNLELGANLPLKVITSVMPSTLPLENIKIIWRPTRLDNKLNIHTSVLYA